MAVPAYPENRLEQYLDAISENTEGGSGNSLPEYPENRTEQYLDAIAKNTAGGGGSGGGGVFVVHAVWDDEGDVATLDKTWNEINNAALDGWLPIIVGSDVSGFDTPRNVVTNVSHLSRTDAYLNDSDEMEYSVIFVTSNYNDVSDEVVWGKTIYKTSSVDGYPDNSWEMEEG